MKGKILIPIFLLSLYLISCNSTEPDNRRKLTLTIDDVSCTEVWLKLSTEGLPSASVINLNKDGNLITKISLGGNKDTVIYIDSLLPNKSYTFQAICESSVFYSASEMMTVITMNTTSHDFRWQNWEFGEEGAGSSTLYDIAIIDENNIWAVGEIYMKDSLGNPDPTFYNLVKWDGINWKLEKVFYYYKGNPIIAHFKSLFAFNDKDIILGGFMNWNGSAFISIPINISFPSDANKIWGISGKDFYIVGSYGNIAHYQYGTWQKIESGTNLNLYDIWGSYYNQSSEAEIISIGSYIGTNSGSIILNILQNSTTEISTKGIVGNSTDIWFKPKQAYYIASSRLYYKHNLSDELWTYKNITSYSITSIYGNDINDVFVAASYGDIIHFNGINWHSYFSQTQLSQGVYGIIKEKNNIVVAAGINRNKAVITIGKR